MPITCPRATNSVAVTVGSGGAGTICVRGRLIGFSTHPLKRKRAADVFDTIDVFVQVYSGTLEEAPGQVGDNPTKAVITNQRWLAQNVPVGVLDAGAASMPGDPLTVVAWQVAASVVERVAMQPFFGVNAGVVGAVDCCWASGSGSGSSSGSALWAAELASSPTLLVSIPDGKKAGSYPATAVSPLEWHLKVGRTAYTIFCDSTGTRLALRSRSATVLHTSIARNPFSATFPGAMFGATIDAVVVVKA